MGPSGFRLHSQVRLVNDRGLGVNCSLPRIFVPFITCHRIFRLLECTPFDLALGFLAVRRMIVVDGCQPGCISWLSYRWRTGKVFSLERYTQVVREHRRSTGNVFLVVPDTILIHS